MLFLFLYLDVVPWKSTQGGFAYIWQIKWVRIIAIKTVRTQIHLLHVSDVLIAVASFDRKVPILVTRATLSVGPQRPLQKKPTGPEDENVHIRTWLRACARSELVRNHSAHSFHIRSQGGTQQNTANSPNHRRR